MRSTAVALSEVVEFADESKRKGLEGTVYLQQKEAAQGGTSFSDEDASGGKAVEKIRLLLETTEDSMYYEDEFEDMDFYKDALVQLERLETYFPIERLSEEEMKQKLEDEEK
ncbi:hypothetical protein [Planomicrobium okeanokoites]|uniref:hypothetical protein n=1 Tax=Planomicrobium okeanokoites TaxID=244 RepID=UPI000A036380|nr:hypothetical protein [Planomicrobium okeanokoites]